MAYKHNVVSVTTSSQTLEELLGFELEDGLDCLTLEPDSSDVFWNMVGVASSSTGKLKSGTSFPISRGNARLIELVVSSGTVDVQVIQGY